MSEEVKIETPVETLQKQLDANEQHLERLKAEMYATLGKIQTLKETIALLQKGN